MKIEKYDLIWDDSVEDESGIWSQVCHKHSFKIPAVNIKESGYGICGVVGCSCTKTEYVILSESK